MVVYLVGAGPGDPELLTLKSKRLIKEADLIIYDKLVNKDILNWRSPECELIYVGKRENTSATSQSIQQNIHSNLLNYGHSKRVVRLKGGDPFIFGRGGEEAEFCVQNKIPFEVVPGISSVFAVPAYAGIPVTHRCVNSCFAVLTGNETDKSSSAIDWSRLPENIIIVMGVKTIRKTAKRLLDARYDPKTPVAVICQGTTPKQQTELLTLEELEREGTKLTPPAVFVVGPIAKFHESLSWFEKKFKMGQRKRIVLTQTQSHQQESRKLLESYGMEVISMPLLKIADRPFSIPSLTDVDAIVFTSKEGVKQLGNKMNLKAFSGKVFAIGPTTKRYIHKQWGISAYMGNRFTSKNLAKHIVEKLTEGSNVVMFRSSAASGILKKKLSKHFDVKEIYVYDIQPLEVDSKKLEKADVVFVVSATCARSISKVDSSLMDGKTIVSIGPETSSVLPFRHIMASNHTIQGMIDEYLDFLWREIS